LDDLLRLYHQLANNRDAAAPAPRMEATQVMDKIGGQAGRHLLVAAIDGHVVGTVDLLIVPNLTRGGASWAMVENVVVDSGQRRRGIGRALMSDVYQRCQRIGCYKIQLLSNKHRGEAHAFYRSVGFEAVAEGFRSYLA